MSTEPPANDLEDRFRAALESGACAEAVALADEAWQAGDFGRSRAWLEAAAEAFPAETRVLRRLLELHHRYRRWKRFDEVAERALREAPPSAALLYTIGCGHEARRAWEDACHAFRRAIELDGDDVESHVRLARCLRASGRAREAIPALRDALGRHDDSAPLHAALGYAWIDVEKPERAVPCFERAVDRDPDWHPYLADLAGALMLCERWEEAARASAWSLKRHRRSERAWTVYAIAHGRLGDAARAEQGYRNAIRAARDPSRAKGNFGLFLAGRPERMLEAIGLLREAHDAHPDWAEVRRRLDRLLAGTD
jgi:tetratricopeptide (TPR) repeat protein